MIIPSPSSTIRKYLAPVTRMLARDEPDPQPTIEVALFYNPMYEEHAHVAETYVTWALEDAFGDEYTIDVSVAASVPDEVNTVDTFTEWIDDEQTAKDANHLLANTSELQAGEWYSISDPNGVEKLPEVVLPTGGGNPRYQMNMILHEIGHSLGMSHKIADEYISGPATPMSTSYIEDSMFTHRYHEDSIAELTLASDE